MITMGKECLDQLRNFANEQLGGIILPFWKKYTLDNEYGGFYGQINDDLSIEPKAEKGLVLNARILWTFSAVYDKLGDPSDLIIAKRAYDYLQNYFFDNKFGGYFWSLTFDGKPLEDKKQIYAQAFVIYGLSEYYKITNNKEVLDQAISLFNLIETNSFDTERNGYIEACTSDWKEIENLRLSPKDMNEKKSQNTHLHVLEAYSNLYRVWPNSLLQAQLENLVRVFTTKIINPVDSHLMLFFDEDWNPKSSSISYGHDIECGWLLHEAALASGNEKLITSTEKTAVNITEAASEGYIPEGALLYEDDREGKHKDHELEWWAQAEAVVGYMNTYGITGEQKYLEMACKIMLFIEKHIVDKENGEWFFRVDRKGNPIRTHEKAGFWKCPYHNARACLEILHRIDLLNA
jgi:mannobiose 2-epimerase